MRESTIERRAREYASARGVICLKFVAPGTRGVPDRIFFHEGRSMLIEFKAPGKKPSRLQTHWIHKFGAAGIPCHWTDSLEEAKRLIDGFVFTS